MKTKFVIIISYIILCTSCNTQSNSNNTLNITLDSQSYLYDLLEKEKPLKNDEFYKEMIDEFSDLFDAEVKEINYSRGKISIGFCDAPSVMEVTDDFMEDAICIEFPSGVTTIRGFAWPTLKNIELPEGLKVIGMGAFSGCTQLTSINIPSSVIAIGEKRDRWYNTPPFQDCINLKNIKLSEGLQTISYGSFMNCI